MLRYQIIIFCLISFLIKNAYGEIYTYLENPEPELYEFYQFGGPSPNKVITDSQGNIIRECWISHDSTDDIKVKLISKVQKKNLCEIKVTATPYSDDPIFSIKNGQCFYDITGNTGWFTTINREKDPTIPYRTWDCG